MASEKDFHIGLLYLVHLLINADDMINEKEQAALKKIIEKEKIPAAVVEDFQRDLKRKKTKDIYHQGIDLISASTDEQKLRAFVHLLKLSEVDGSVHVKEVRLLLYSIKKASIEFDDVVAEANKLNY